MRNITVAIMVLLGVGVFEAPSLQAKEASPPTNRLLVRDKSLRVLQLDPRSDPAATIQSLKEEGFEVEPDVKIRAHALPNDEHFRDQWHLSEAPGGIEAEAGWDVTHDAAEVLIAVIDSGCALEHPDLAPNLWRNEAEIPDNGVDDDGNGYIDDIHGYDFVNHDGDPEDDSSHGSMVFGILAAAGDNGIGIAGVAWRSKVMCLKVLDSDDQGNLSDTIRAIEYAVAQGAQVLNLSWGYSTAAPSLFLFNALADAGRAGVLTVASAGNDAAENRDELGEISNYPSSYSIPQLISVASTGRGNAMSQFSNYGGASVDLAAPGEEILTTGLGGLTTFTGTSASAAVVSGAVALLWSHRPELSAAEMKQQMLASTIPLPSLQGKTVSGGKLDLAAALGSHLPADSVPADPSAISMGAGEGGCAIQLHAGSGSGMELVLAALGLLGIISLRRRA